MDEDGKTCMLIPSFSLYLHIVMILDRFIFQWFRLSVKTATCYNRHSNQTNHPTTKWRGIDSPVKGRVSDFWVTSHLLVNERKTATKTQRACSSLPLLLILTKKTPSHEFNPSSDPDFIASCVSDWLVVVLGAGCHHSVSIPVNRARLVYEDQVLCPWSESCIIFP